MLFNCFSCGRLISLRKDLCPHCMVDLGMARDNMENAKKKKASFAKKRGSFLWFFSR